MDLKTLKWLLSQPESTALEFKRKLDLDNTDKEARNRQRDEFIKDILSLANGNATTVGEEAYLIIGAGNELRVDGARQLFDVDTSRLTQKRIMQIVNEACKPRIQDIECDTIEVEGNHLLVITVWPTPHLHETTCRLATPKSTYNEHVVFIRNNENIAIANQKEREVLLKLKQIHFADTRKAPPVKFGVIVAALIGALMAGASAHKDKTNPPTKNETVNTAIAGSIVSTPVGALIGWLFTEFLDTKYDWYFRSKRQRFVFVFGSLGFAVVFWRVYKMLWLMLANFISKANDSTDRRGGA